MTTTPPVSELSTAVDESAAAFIAQLPSPESRRSYTHVWKYYRIWLDEQQLDATAVRPRHVQLYIAKRREDGLKKGSIGRVLSVLRSIYGQVVCDELMDVNPAREVKKPRMIGTPNAPWIKTPEDIKKLINVPGDSWKERRDRLCVRLLLGLGWRRAEVARVTLEDIDGDAVSVICKGGARKTFGLPDFCMEEIFEWRMYAGIDSGPLLIRGTEDRRAVSGAIVYAMVRRASERSGIGKFAPHSLRRTAGTYLGKKGKTLKERQLMFGHASTRTTEGYDKDTDARGNKPGEAFGEFVEARA